MQFVLENLWAVYDAVLRRLVVVLLGTKQSLFLTCNPVALRLIQLPTLLPLLNILFYCNLQQVSVNFGLGEG